MKKSKFQVQALLIAKLMGSIGSIALITTPAFAMEAYGNPFEYDGFVKDDWQVVCDNTLTCRVAGYSGEDSFNTPASIMFVIEPKQTLPNAYVNLIPKINNNAKHSNKLELWLNNKNFGALRVDNSSTELSSLALTTQQAKALLANAKKNTKIEIKSAKNVWSISDKGLSAVLLKLDEVQGRVGTPLAWVSKNNPKPQTPKQARPKPVIKKAFYYPKTINKKLDAQTLTFFKNNITTWVDVDSEQYRDDENAMGDCELINPNNESTQTLMKYNSSIGDWHFTPVDSQHTLASHVCWTGAYNQGNGYWLINNEQPNKLKMITTSASHYANGKISAVQKGRGLGDCWSRAEWVWNGKDFVKSYEQTTGMCRGFAGGAWALPTYVSNIVTDSQGAQ